MMNLSEIVDGGYCIGCGACRAVDEGIGISFDEFGKFQANLEEASMALDSESLRVCPFADVGGDETEIAGELFGDTCEFDDRLGYYDGLYAGHVAEGQFRDLGTSGGVITWLCCEMLELGLVDHVIHVKTHHGEPEDRLFSYGISSSVDEVCKGAKSRYYPVEMSGVLETLKNTPGKYVLVGLPCFVKSVRRLMKINPIIRERVLFCVGLVCGHLKSKAFADCFAWQKGIKPGGLEEIDFRVKLPGRRAGDYGVSLVGEGKESTQPSKEFLGFNWGHNFFRYPACSYCDDVFAETADVVVGDAWLNQYEADSKGNSVVVARNPTLRALIDGAVEAGRLNLNKEPVDMIAASQGGGLRDRRDGLSYRLYLREKDGKSYPQKRVSPSKTVVPFGRRQIYRMRLRLEEASHVYWRQAVERNDLGFFRKKMGRLIFLNGLLWDNLSRLALAKARGAIRRLRSAFSAR